MCQHIGWVASLRLNLSELTRRNRLLEELNRFFLASEAVTLLMVKPAKLLKNLGMVGVSIKYPLVGILGAVKVLLLFVDVPNLEPNVLLR